jgi:hypothetical protein
MHERRSLSLAPASTPHRPESREQLKDVLGNAHGGPGHSSGIRRTLAPTPRRCWSCKVLVRRSIRASHRLEDLELETNVLRDAYIAAR